MVITGVLEYKLLIHITHLYIFHDITRLKIICYILPLFIHGEENITFFLVSGENSTKNILLNTLPIPTDNLYLISVMAVQMVFICILFYLTRGGPNRDVDDSQFKFVYIVRSLF